MNEILIAKRISLYFTILAALFIGLSPQFLGFVLPLMFLIPIFMALSGLKRRRKSGFFIAMCIIPLALSVSIIWIRYSLMVFNNLPAELARISAQTNISKDSAQLLTSFSFVLSLVMMGLCGTLFAKLLKYKGIFK